MNKQAKSPNAQSTVVDARLSSSTARRWTRPALLLAISTLAVGLIAVNAGTIPHWRSGAFDTALDQPKQLLQPAVYGVELVPYEPRSALSIRYNRAKASVAGFFQPKAEAQPPKVWNTIPNETESGGLKVAAKVFSSTGAVAPDETFPIVLEYSTGSAAVAAATLKVTLHPSAVFVKAIPAATSGTGSSGTPLVFALAGLAPDTSNKIVIQARAKSTTEDPEVMWKSIFSDVSVEVAGQPAVALRTHGPKVTTLKTTRIGDRPFPVVMVQYQDIKHCTGKDERGGLPTDANDPSCPEAHSAANLDNAVNSNTSNRSLYQLYQDMSFGQLFPIGRVSPSPDAPADIGFDATYIHKFSASPVPTPGTCTGTTLAASKGTPVYPNRVEGGWYNLPGTQGYYGSDKYGSNIAASAAGQAAVGGIDDGCGPTAKIIYDAASLADPDIDYNDFDTDKDGVVDFFNLMFAGDGGNGATTTTGPNNIWPHKSDVRFYFVDANGETGYVSNDQLKNHFGEPMYWLDASRQVMTTDAGSGIKVFVRVGPYNANPEDANEFVSVIGHEYGHSLNLPDYYSLGSRGTYASWNLMATDYFHFYPAYDRARLGWIVPRKLQTGEVTLTESKTDTGEIHWVRPDGTPYVLTGEGIHNGDTYKVNLPTAKLIDQVPSGTHAWFSGAGNDFGCPGHYLDVFVPGMANTGSAAAVSLKFKSLYEIEWDFDYGFVLVSIDNGRSFTSVASKKGTTMASRYNPNSNACLAQYNNGITGTFAGGGNTLTNSNRTTGGYPDAVFIDDEFDLTAFKGKTVIVRFAYSTDPGLAKKGWFIDDLNITADGMPVYTTDFENGREPDQLFPRNWALASTADGVDTEHAYYIELRDRLNNDFDGKGQSSRGSPTWEPGISMIYTDENHGYGNVGTDDPPAQSPVDSAPQPGNESPNLDDAAFTLTRPNFNGCAHIDNYTDAAGPNGQWQLPEGLKFTVTDISGVVGTTTDGVAPAQAATAKLLAEISPDCSLQILSPEISIDSGYEDPDTNGNYRLKWTRPTGAVGPDTLQEATVFSVLLADNAEGGLGKWLSTTQGTGAMAWAASTLKKHAGSNSFRGTYSNGSDAAQTGNKPAALLTLKDAIAIPATGETELSYWDFFINEGDDSVVLEATQDDGVTWDTINASARSELAPDAAPLVATEALTLHKYSLADYAGKSIKLRYRMQSGGEDRAGSAPFGWFIDDIMVQTSNFADLLAKTPATGADITGHGAGDYYYRVKTSYPAGPVTVPSAFSNIIKLTVKEGVVAAPPPTPTPGGSTPPPVVGGVVPVPSPATTAATGSGRFGGALGSELLALLAFGAALRRRRHRV